MILIEWNEVFAVAVPEVDRDHQELIEDINDLYEQLGSDDNELTITEFLGAVYAKAHAHFVREEQMMLENDYSGYVDHKAEHEQFLETVGERVDEYQDDVRTEDAEMALWASHWFVKHFQIHDALLHKLGDQRD